MPNQIFDVLDYFAPVVVGVIFAALLFVVSFCINFLCVRKSDDITAFERWGVRRNMRLGPHSLKTIRTVMQREAGDYDDDESEPVVGNA